MSSDLQDVTLGEVYRLCQSIDAKVEKQNGRVSRHTERLDAVEKDLVRVKTIWSIAVIALGLAADSLKRRIGLS